MSEPTRPIKALSAPGHGPSQLAEMTRHYNVMAEIERRELEEMHLHHAPPKRDKRSLGNKPKKCPSCKGRHLGRRLLCAECKALIIEQTQHLKP